MELFVICLRVKVYLCKYSCWDELSMNINEGKG